MDYTTVAHFHHHVNPLPTSNVSTIVLGIIDQDDKDNIRFEDTYNVLLSGKLTKDEFDNIIRDINNNRNIRKWLRFVYDGNSSAKFALGMLLFIVTLGVGLIILVGIDEAKAKKLKIKMSRSMTTILQRANAKTPSCSWTFVRPSTRLDSWYIRIDTC